MEIQTDAIRGTYEELLDAAEDLGGILNAAATDLLDLTPIVEVWLVDQLERTELALTSQLDGGGRGRGTTTAYV
jgi:hypothetical protein